MTNYRIFLLAFFVICYLSGIRAEEELDVEQKTIITESDTAALKAFLVRLFTDSLMLVGSLYILIVLLGPIANKEGTGRSYTHEGASLALGRALNSSVKTWLTTSTERLQDLMVTLGGASTLVYGIFMVLHILFGHLFVYRKRRSIPVGLSEGIFQSLPSGIPLDSSYLGMVMDSLDLVNLTFGVMDVEDVECRKRTICEIQRTASRIPIVGRYFETFSPSIKGMEKYREAQEAGAALQDCRLLFQCSSSVVPFN